MSAQSVHGFSFLGWFRLPSKAERMERRLAKIGHQPTPAQTPRQSLPFNWCYQHATPHFAPVVLPLRQQTGAITPIPRIPGNTDGVPRLPRLPMPRDNRAVIAELETSKGLPGLPRWVADLRNNPPVSVHEVSGVLETPEVPAWANQEVQERRISDALAKVNSAALYVKDAWLSAELPEPTALVLQPMDSQALASADQLAVSRTTEEPDSALLEIATWASRYDPDKTEAAIPAMISQQARKLQGLMRESE